MTRNRGALGVLFLTVVLDLVGFGIVIPLQAFIAEQFDASPMQVTLLMASYSLAQFVAAPIWGQLSDRYGRRPALLFSIGMTAVMLAGFASATSLTALFVFRILHGVMTANIAIAQACVADLTTPETRAKGMGLIGAGFGIGFTIGPFIGGELSQSSLATPIWFAAALSLINLCVGIIWLPETRRSDSATTSRSISPTALLQSLRHPAVGPCIALLAAYIFAFATMESCFTLFAEHQHGLKPENIGRLFGLVGIVGMVVQGGLIGPMVRRFGERKLIPVGMTLLSGGTLALGFVPVGLPMTVTFIVLSAGQSLVTPCLNALISKGAHADEQGRVLGSAQSMAALSRAVGPAVGGLLFSHVSMSAPFLASALIVAFAGLAAWPVTARAVPA